MYTCIIFFQNRVHHHRITWNYCILQIKSMFVGYMYPPPSSACVIFNGTAHHLNDKPPVDHYRSNILGE